MRRVLVAAAAGGVLLGCAQSAAGEDAPGQPVVGQPTPADQRPGAPQTSSEPSEGNWPDRDAGPEASGTAAEAGAAAPERVQIPSIDLDEDELIDLGIQSDGRLEVPTDWDDVGWFAGGSRPGEAGPTVIAAHVDSRSGPAVFYRLPEMERGDEVTVVDAEGGVHLYQVERTADFPKDDFPTREVFGAGTEDELRLITCTGEFDAAAGRHLDNRVVFASRVE